MISASELHNAIAGAIDALHGPPKELLRNATIINDDTVTELRKHRDWPPQQERGYRSLVFLVPNKLASLIVPSVTNKIEAAIHDQIWHMDDEEFNGYGLYFCTPGRLAEIQLARTATEKT